MIRKRLSPEERRGVLMVAVVALLLLLCGFCSRYGAGCARRVDNPSPAVMLAGDSVSGQSDDNGSGRDTLRGSGSSSRSSSSSRSRSGHTYRKSSRRRSAAPPPERNYLDDTIPPAPARAL